MKNKKVLISILKEIKKNPYITEKELGDKLFYHERTVRRYIKILKEMYIIRIEKWGINKKWVINRIVKK